VKTNKVFDVSGSKDVEATRVTMYNKHNGANQRWRIVYVEEFKEQHKGLIEEYGLYANRAFYIRSELPNHRLA
jgi:outer membrane receptor for Fe3+-dicitrate